MNKTCHHSIWQSDKVNYVNVEWTNNIQKEIDLDTVCIERKGKCDMYNCDTRKFLLELLSHNNIKQK